MVVVYYIFGQTDQGKHCRSRLELTYLCVKGKGMCQKRHFRGNFEFVQSHQSLHCLHTLNMENENFSVFTVTYCLL